MVIDFIRQTQTTLRVGIVWLITEKADLVVNIMQNGFVIQDNLPIGNTLNRLAREQMKKKLLADILVDMTVCEIEGISKLEYLDELIEMLLEIRRVPKEERKGAV